MKGHSADDAEAVIARLRAGFEDGSMNPDHLMFFSSRAPDINAQVQRALPGLAVPKLVRQRMDLCLAGFARTGTFQDDCIGQDIAVSVERMDAMGPQAQQLAAAVHSMGGTLHVYGVNSEAAYRFAQSLSADFIWTDRIEALDL
jgi:glycerophosphoryl diester phosphodiesterase